MPPFIFSGTGSEVHSANLEKSTVLTVEALSIKQATLKIKNPNGKTVALTISPGEIISLTKNFVAGLYKFKISEKCIYTMKIEDSSSISREAAKAALINAVTQPKLGGCKIDDLNKKSDREQKFSGSLEARVFNTINSNENVRIHNINLSNSSQATFTLKWNDPNSRLLLNVYTRYSITTNSNTEAFPFLNTFFGEQFDFVTALPRGTSPSSLTLDRDWTFIPTDYILSVVNLESSQEVDYEITISYDDLSSFCGSKKKKEKNLITGFWQADTPGIDFSLFIKERLDGSFYALNYSGNEDNGYQLVNAIRAVDIKTVKGGYLIGSTRYLYLNQLDANRLLSFVAGEFNKVTSDNAFRQYSRIENPKIIEYFNTAISFSPEFYLNDFFNNLVKTTNPQTNQKADSNDYPGFQKMVDLKNSILTTGIAENFVGLDIWPELTSFGSSFVGTNIRTYAPSVLEKIEISTTIELGNELFFTVSSTNLKQGMLVELSNFIGLPSEGVPTEWVNGLFFVTFVDVTANGVTVYLLSTLLQFDYQIKTWIENKITITPRCIEVVGQNLPTLRQFINNNNASIVRLSGFSKTGGIAPNIINSIFTVYSVTSTNSFFVVLDKNFIATKTEESSSSLGKIETTNFPTIPSNARLINIRSRTGFYAPLTYFFTDKPTICGPCSRVKISGLTGDYSCLNGDHDIHPFADFFYNNRNTEEVYSKEFYPENRKFYTAIKVSSVGLPSFNPAIHTEKGFFTINRIIYPLINDSNYGNFTDACDFLSKKLGVNTHSSFNAYLDFEEGSSQPSWERIQRQISNGITNSYNISSRTRDPVAGVFKYIGTAAITNFMMNELNKNSYNGVRGNPINISTRMDPTRTDTLFLTANQITKYLSAGQIFNVYATISGETLNERIPGSDPLNQNISARLVQFGYNANGTTINYQTRQFVSNIIFNLTSPNNARYYLQNSFATSGVLLRPISGEIILANPPLADIPLINSEACAGKIVIIIVGSVNFATKYINAVNAGAIGVILVNDNFDNLGNASLQTSIQNQVMIYSLNGLDGNVLTGYKGGDVNDPSNYTLPIIDNSNYNGEIRPPLISERLVQVGTSNFRFGKIDSRFTNNKNIGYINLPNSILSTPQRLEYDTVFFDKYNDPNSNAIDIFARMWSAVLNTSFNIDGQMIKLINFDSLIIDNSVNTGGRREAGIALASFFGNNRPSINNQTSLRGSGYDEPETYKQLEKSLPPISQRDTIYINDPEEIPCDKFQTRYLTRFEGTKLIFLTSNTALSTGDIYPHYFRNVKATSPGDLGNNLVCSFVGTIDGRLQGTNEFGGLYNIFTRNSRISIAPSITGISAPIYAYLYSSESLRWAYNIGNSKTICSQRSEIAIDGVNNGGPLACWNEDEGGIYQAWGFSTPYLRDNERYQRFNEVFGLPIPYQQNTYHQPWIEDAILAASDE